MTAKIDVIRNAIPQFISVLENAKNEDDISSACREIKNLVDKVFNRTEGRRDARAMREIRNAVETRFPTKPVDSEVSDEFPYYYTDSKKGRVKRLEHLAFKHLMDERNPQTDFSDLESQEKPEVEAIQTEAIEQDIDIFGYVGLNDEELAIVKEAIGDADIKEWIKQAMLQRANAINALHERLSEDLSAVSSEELMTDKKYRTNANACRELTSRAVRAIKAFNAQSPEHRWCITNKLISELTGNTVKAIAKAVEGMDIESYNQTMDLQPIHNRLTKAAIGDIKAVVSIKDVLGVDE